jgi:hypothetical protein
MDVLAPYISMIRFDMANQADLAAKAGSEEAESGEKFADLRQIKDPSHR